MTKTLSLLRAASAALEPFGAFAVKARGFVERAAAEGGSPIMPTKDFRLSHFAHADAVKGEIDKALGDAAAAPKIVVLCGSSRFIQIMAVCGWLIERDERAIAMGLHLLPTWYPDCPPDHLAEHEGVADAMDALHLRKIDLADEIFVIDVGGYIGSSTRNEIAHARRLGKPVRFLMSDPLLNTLAPLLAAATASPSSPPTTASANPGA